MKYEQFKEKFATDLRNVLEEKVGDIEMYVQDTQKIQNAPYQALTIKKIDSNVGIGVNLNDIYKSLGTHSYEELVSKTAEQFADSLLNTPDFNFLTAYDTAKEYLVFQLVNTERNAELLKDIPHKEIKDLSLICRVAQTTVFLEPGNFSTVVNNSMLSHYGITKEQLFEDTLENVLRTEPASITPMKDLLKEMIKGNFAEEFEMPSEINMEMYVATNQSKMNGASIIEYPDFLSDAAEKLGGSFYILPSSIHELILMPERFCESPEELVDMVKDVNSTQVAPEEVLSDNVYHYDSEKALLETMEEYEERMQDRDEIAR